MKNALIVACALLFASVAGSAQPSSEAHLARGSLAWFLGQHEATASCATQQSRLLLTAEPQSFRPQALCTATADSASGTVGQLPSTAVQPVVLLPPKQDSETGRVCNACCQCTQTGDCFECCLCDGHSRSYCLQLCYR
jgi:hypothetical protein